jgi:hypothetical protein
LNEITILLHNLFAELPNLVNGLGVDAFFCSSSNNSNDLQTNNKFGLTTLEGREKKDFSGSEYSV